MHRKDKKFVSTVIEVFHHLRQQDMPKRRLPPLPVPPERQASSTGASSSPPPELSSSTVVRVGDQMITIDARKLITVESLGRGRYGEVRLMLDRDSDLQFAVKLVPYMFGTPDTAEEEKQWRELNVIQRTSTCRFCVYFYGAMVCEGELYLMMERLDKSLDKLLVLANEKGESLPEDFIREVAYSVLCALDFMKDLNISHRDIKPSNILADRHGHIKVCDFGIAGNLVNSRLNTFIGDMSYMAPERVDHNGMGYTAKSDVWSLGVTLVELTLGCCPYSSQGSTFERMQRVLYGPIPSMPERCSLEARDFVAQCMLQSESARPLFRDLLCHAWLRTYDDEAPLANSSCARLLSSLLDDASDTEMEN